MIILEFFNNYIYTVIRCTIIYQNAFQIHTFALLNDD